MTNTRRFLWFVVGFLGTMVFWASTADAHLVAKPKRDTIPAVIASQKENLAHAKYVCRRGAGQHKRWSCSAYRGWLSREHKEWKAKLNPAPSGMWYAIAMCESSLGTGRPQWHINTGNGFYGGLQFDYGTWHEAQRNLGVYWTEYAHQAEPWQQVKAASTLPLTRWPVCGAPYR